MHSEKNWPLESALLLLVGVMMAFAFGVIAIGLTKQVGTDFTGDQERFFAFVINTICFHGATIFLTHYFLQQNGITWAEFFGWKSASLKRALITSLIVIVFALPVVLVFNELMRNLITRLHSAPETQPTIQILELSVSLGQRICFGFAAIVVAPIAEEILFRGVLYRTVRMCGFPKIALWSTALLFALVHGSAPAFLPLTALAIIFTLLYNNTGTLVAPIFAHSLFNAVNFFGYLYRDQLTEWWKQLMR